MDYKASGGKEILLSFEDENETLFGLLRIRIQPKRLDRLDPEIGEKIALIRELHIYGQEVSLSQRIDAAAQHKGFGKSLLRQAEQIACEEFKADAMAILSGVGAREYYRDYGYTYMNGYMVKRL